MSSELLKPHKKILVCARCTSPWEKEFSPADCEVCRKPSYAIVGVSYIGLGLGDEKCPSCAHAGQEPLCENCAGENYGSTTEITSSAGCPNWRPVAVPEPVAAQPVSEGSQ